MEQQLTEDLWDVVQAAKYFRCCPRQFRERIAVLPGFPPAIRIPTPTGGKGQPRWAPEKVRAWALSHQEEAA